MTVSLSLLLFKRIDADIILKQRKKKRNTILFSFFFYAAALLINEAVCVYFSC